MDSYVVIQYDAVDIRQVGDRESRSTPGAPALASVIHAAGEAEAIRLTADGREGFFSAFPLPIGLEVVRAELVLHD
jgi:hypothetical protein